MAVNNNEFQGVVADNVLDLIGKTPVVRLQKVTSNEMATIWAKLERQNPGGCIKERISLAMIQAAERDGIIRPGSMIVEPTSGNTGIGLAMVSAFKGYHLTLVMPDTLSMERRKLFQAYGAEMVLIPGAGGMKSAIAKAKEIVTSSTAFRCICCRCWYRGNHYRCWRSIKSRITTRRNRRCRTC